MLISLRCAPQTPSVTPPSLPQNSQRSLWVSSSIGNASGFHNGPLRTIPSFPSKSWYCFLFPESLLPFLPLLFSLRSVYRYLFASFLQYKYHGFFYFIFVTFIFHSYLFYPSFILFIHYFASVLISSFHKVHENSYDRILIFDFFLFFSFFVLICFHFLLIFSLFCFVVLLFPSSTQYKLIFTTINDFWFLSYNSLIFDVHRCVTFIFRLLSPSFPFFHCLTS